MTINFGTTELAETRGAVAGAEKADDHVCGPSIPPSQSDSLFQQKFGTAPMSKATHHHLRPRGEKRVVEAGWPKD
jgi:hypothetical protein